MVAPINRTVETFNILQSQIPQKLPAKYCSYMIGINNGMWSGKSLKMLDSHNLYVFLQREYAHNIFAKVKNGDSWGDVLVRCTKLLYEINKKYEGQSVLLISQGSIYQGLKILLHKEKTPWNEYSASAMFCTTPNDERQLGYGRLFTID